MEKLLTGRKVAVLVEDVYEELEVWYPVLRLREEGAQVVIAGTGGDSYTGKYGYPAQADIGVDRLAVADLDAIVIPGGYAPDRLRRYPAVLKLVREAFQQGKVIAAICHAAWVPISAGIMKGRRATCFFGIKDDLINAGAHYEDAEVIRDGNLITSRQPSDLGAFCREIILALAQER